SVVSVWVWCGRDGVLVRVARHWRASRQWHDQNFDPRKVRTAPSSVDRSAIDRHLLPRPPRREKEECRGCRTRRGGVCAGDGEKRVRGGLSWPPGARPV